MIVIDDLLILMHQKPFRVFLLIRDIEKFSEEAICYISPFIEIIEPSTNFSKIAIDMLNEYIKEEKRAHLH